MGCWRITHSRMCLNPGYHSDLWTVRDMPALLRSTGGDPPAWETWMSLSPHEIESQNPNLPVE